MTARAPRRAGIKAEDVAGIVARWRRNGAPAVGAAGRQATPAQRLCRKIRRTISLATGFVHGSVGLGAFTESAIRDERVLALAAK